MSRLVKFAPLLIFLIFGVALGVALFLRDRSPETGTLVGAAAPDFALRGLELEPDGLTRAQLADGPVLVNVFASWCAPCRIEHPRLVALADEGARIYGVIWRDSPQAARAMLEELGSPYAAVGVDRNGRWGEEWAVRGAPETFLIDADGVVRMHIRGPLSARDIEEVIRPALGL